MVKNSDENIDVDIEITDKEPDIEDLELEEVEEKSKDKLQKLRNKLKTCEADKRQALEDLQRAKAEFLNARKRIEEEKINDRMRTKLMHAEELLPLCDSFEMAMKDKKAWEEAPKAWRAGIKGIHMQLQKLLQSYGVEQLKAKGEPFDPTKHEAVSTETVEDKNKQDTVLSVIQNGYQITFGSDTRIIRPARVTTGKFEKQH